MLCCASKSPPTRSTPIARHRSPEFSIVTSPRRTTSSPSTPNWPSSPKPAPRLRLPRPLPYRQRICRTICPADGRVVADGRETDHGARGVDVTAIARLRATHKDDFLYRTGLKLSFLPSSPKQLSTNSPSTGSSTPPEHRGHRSELLRPPPPRASIHDHPARPEHINLSNHG